MLKCSLNTAIIEVFRVQSYFIRHILLLIRFFINYFKHFLSLHIYMIDRIITEENDHFFEQDLVNR